MTSPLWSSPPRLLRRYAPSNDEEGRINKYRRRFVRDTTTRDMLYQYYERAEEAQASLMRASSTL